MYLDKAFPERPEYAYGGGKAHDSPNRVFDVQKHWWGWKILEQDYLAACELVGWRGTECAQTAFQFLYVSTQCQG